MPRQQPRLPTQVGTSATGKTTIAVKERQAFTRLPLARADLVGRDGNLDPEAVCRVINMIQDNVHTATAPARNDPTSNKKIVQQVAMKSGTPVKIQHGLSAYVGAWFQTRAYSGSQPFAAVEAQYGSSQWPSSVDQTQWIVLIPSCTGTYDIAFCPA